MESVASAKKDFDEGLNCAQSVLLAFAPRFGMSRETAAKLACGFGAGIARYQKTCGAVTGAVMALGLKYGNASGSDQAAKERVYALTRRFIERFNELHGTTECRDLLGCDLNTEEGMKKHREGDQKRTVCEPCVADAVKIIEELLK
jgi:C_GCAxxG_C_C family probable redox protein